MVAERSDPIEGSAKPDDLADHDDRGRLDPGRNGRDPAQCRHDDALLCGRRLADDGYRLLGPAAARHQLRSDTRQMPRSHVEHENRGALGDCPPVEAAWHLSVAVVSGEEGHGGVGVAVGDGDPGIGEPGDTCGDPRHDAERDAPRHVKGTADAPEAELEPNDAARIMS